MSAFSGWSASWERIRIAGEKPFHHPRLVVADIGQEAADVAPVRRRRHSRARGRAAEQRQAVHDLGQIIARRFSGTDPGDIAALFLGYRQYRTD